MQIPTAAGQQNQLGSGAMSKHQMPQHIDAQPGAAASTAPSRTTKPAVLPMAAIRRVLPAGEPLQGATQTVSGLALKAAAGHGLPDDPQDAGVEQFIAQRAGNAATAAQQRGAPQGGAGQRGAGKSAQVPGNTEAAAKRRQPATKRDAVTSRSLRAEAAALRGAKRVTVPADSGTSGGGGQGAQDGGRNRAQAEAAAAEQPAPSSADGQNSLLIVSGMVLAGALLLLGLLSSGTTQPFLLVLLAILAMVGVFFLFGLAAGHIRIGERLSSPDLAAFAGDALDDAIQITDAAGDMIYANRAFRDLVGTRQGDEPATLHDLVLGDEEAGGALFRLSRAAERGEAWQEEFQIPVAAQSSGATEGASVGRQRAASTTKVNRCYRIALRPLVQESVSGAPRKLVHWRLVDITDERARAGENSLDLQRQLASVEQLPVGLMTLSGKGRILSINPTLAGWLGYADQDAPNIPQSIRELTGGKRDHRIMKLLHRGPDATVDDVHSLDVDLPGVDGEKLPLKFLQPVPLPAPDGRDDTDAPTYRVTVLRRDDDSMLGAGAEASEVRLFRLFETAPFGIATVDPAGRIIAKNRLFERMFRTDRARPKQSLAKLLPRSCDSDMRKRLLSAVEEVSTEQSDLAPIDISFGPKGEHSRRIFAMPFKGNGETGETAILYAVDTTEQKALELKFAQSQKMEAVGQLAGGIAHDFNNVLTVILGLSDLFMQTRRPTDPGYNDIMQIRSNAHRAAGMVRQLLAFSRKQKLSATALVLNDVVQDLVYSLDRLLGERIELKMHCQRNLWSVKADQTQLEQVIINLAVNARDAMPEGGRLTIRTKNISERDAAGLAEHGMSHGEYVMIEVKDEGVGMPEDVLAKIFDPFYSTKDVGKGTGLGLSTVYGIVKQTGGYVFADSKLGKGTSFKVYLPRHDVAAGESGKAPAKAVAKEAPRDLTGSGRVLLVEDEDGVRSFAMRALQRQGYEVLEAASGVEALEVMEENEGRVDIVVSDVVMPEMDGPTLLKNLRNDNPGIKFIFMSGYPDDAFSKGLDASEDFAFLPKPFTLPQLAAKVKEELDR